MIAQKPAKSPEKWPCPDTAAQPPRAQHHPDGQASADAVGHLPSAGLFVPLVTWKSTLASSASLPRVGRGVTRQPSPPVTHQPCITPQVGQSPCTVSRPGNEAVTPVSPAPFAHPHAHADPTSTNMLWDPSLHVMQLQRNKFLRELQGALTHKVKPVGHTAQHRPFMSPWEIE